MCLLSFSQACSVPGSSAGLLSLASTVLQWGSPAEHPAVCYAHLHYHGCSHTSNQHQGLETVKATPFICPTTLCPSIHIATDCKIKIVHSIRPPILTTVIELWVISYSLLVHIIFLVLCSTWIYADYEKVKYYWNAQTKKLRYSLIPSSKQFLFQGKHHQQFVVCLSGIFLFSHKVALCS